MLLSCLPVASYVSNTVTNVEQTGAFEGERKLKLFKHGKGTKTYKDGMFEGDWSWGSRRHGKETWYRREVIPGAPQWALATGGGTAILTDTYDGQFKMNTPHGFGRLEMSHLEPEPSDVYVGQWSWGKRNGLGRLGFSNGDAYIGEFRKNKFHGFGVFWFEGGSQLYVGMFHKNMKHGHGICTYDDGVYHGTFVDDKREGIGRFTFSIDEVRDYKVLPKVLHELDNMFWRRGDTYVGEWLNDKMHGLGKVKYANGNAYIGEWNFGRRHGWGMEKLDNGNAYAGQWSAARKHGNGVFMWKLGDIYCGGYKFGLKDGFGVEKWVDGDEYRGEYRQSQIHGHGVLTRKGKKQYKGRFEEGELVKSVFAQELVDPLSPEELIKLTARVKRAEKKAVALMATCKDQASSMQQKAVEADIVLSSSDTFDYALFYKLVVNSVSQIDRTEAVTLLDSALITRLHLKIDDDVFGEAYTDQAPGYIQDALRSSSKLVAQKPRRVAVASSDPPASQQTSVTGLLKRPLGRFRKTRSTSAVSVDSADLFPPNQAKPKWWLQVKKEK